jgi:hypothetical protein
MDELNFLYRKAEEPSKDMSEYWKYTISKNEYPKHTEYGGKWLIFCDKKTVDNTWIRLQDIQQKGMLGNVMKVATALSAMRFNGQHVICIYTYDSRDNNDVIRVRDSLKSIGFKDPLNYKRDIETKNGVYGNENEFFLTI